MNVGISDKLLTNWLKDKDYITASDEGEAIGIAGGYFLATGKPATVFMSADGLCNALNPLTSWVLPYGVKMHLVISRGRTEPQHYIMTDLSSYIITMLEHYDEHKSISYEFVEKES